MAPIGIKPHINKILALEAYTPISVVNKNPKFRQHNNRYMILRFAIDVLNICFEQKNNKIRCNKTSWYIYCHKQNVK